MLPPNDYTLMQDYEKNKLPAIMTSAEEGRMLREAGLIRQPWLSCQIFHSLWHLGRALVAAGQRLERRYAPLTLSHA